MTASKLKVKSILVTQPKPESDKNPYAELAKKYNLKLDFRPFIHVEGVSAKEFRVNRVQLSEYTAVIFTSRHGIDQYFRLCEEMRFDVPVEQKYFCNTESTALYLQKYVQYRKRRVFFGKQTSLDLMEQFKKHPGEKFLFPCSDVSRDELLTKMRSAGYDATDSVMYRTVCSDLSDLAEVKYDMIAFFSPSGIKSLYQNFPGFVQNTTRIAAFGVSTHKAVLEAGLHLDVPAPTPQAPSMTMAIEDYIKLLK